MAKILYLGNNNPATTSFHRANALRRLGHTVTVFDPDEMISSLALAKYLEPFHFRTGYKHVQKRVTKWIKQVVKFTPHTDLIWVNSGEKLGPQSLLELKKIGMPIILYNNDDPMGARDGGRFNSLIKALPHYDLCVVMRKMNVTEFLEKGAKKVLRVWMSYDEVAHKPFEKDSDIPQAFRSDVVFIGTWMRNEKRDEFLLALIKSGLRLAIYGDRWEKSAYFEQLKPYYKGRSLSGSNYVAAMQGAKVCLGLLSKGNRDLHTQRSSEIPYAGGLLCAERTSEHLELYKEGSEAVFWSEWQECIKLCKQLIKDDNMRIDILEKGINRVRANKIGNEDICCQILEELAMIKNAEMLQESAAKY